MASSSACGICLSDLSWLQRIRLCHPGLITASSPFCHSQRKGTPPWKLHFSRSVLSTCTPQKACSPKIKGTVGAWCSVNVNVWLGQMDQAIPGKRPPRARNIAAHSSSLSPAPIFQMIKLRLLKILNPWGALRSLQARKPFCVSLFLVGQPPAFMIFP